MKSLHITPDGKKLCVECGKPWPPTTEFFYRRAASSDGLQRRCKRCDCATRCRSLVHGDTIYHYIARELGVTVTRIKQIEASAFRKIRRSPLGCALESYWRAA